MKEITDQEIGYYRKYNPDDLSEESDIFGNFLPFIKGVVPRIAEIQNSSSHVNLICIEGRLSCRSTVPSGELIFNECEGYAREKSIITFGLDPLVRASILNNKEVEEILKWFANIQVLVHERGAFSKHIELKDEKYTLYTRHIELEDAKYTLYTSQRKERRKLCLGLDHIHF